MALRNLRMFGDGILRKQSKPVKDVDDRILALLDDMRETMDKYNGRGIAAPQVGVLKRVVIVSSDEDWDATGGECLELINPEIVASEGLQCCHEGCLSLPGKTAVVKRPAQVVVKALDRNGHETTVTGRGALAVALCHELDHLDGVLYTDKAEPSDDGDDE